MEVGERLRGSSGESLLLGQGELAGVMDEKREAGREGTPSKILVRGVDEAEGLVRDRKERWSCWLRRRWR